MNVLFSAAFNDIFDEETWYQFCFIFVCCTVACVFILSRLAGCSIIVPTTFLVGRYVELRSQDPLDREHKGVRSKSAMPPPKAKKKDVLIKEE